MSDYWWSVATGKVSPFSKASRKAVEFMSKQEGFKGAKGVDNHGMLWFYDTENNAKGARNMARLKGIKCGNNICRFKVMDDGALEMDDPRYNEVRK